MRLVQVTVPAGKREAILNALDDEGVDYVVTEESSGREYTAVVSFPLPTNAVEPILESLREAGVERDAYTVVLDAETVLSDKFDRLQQRYDEDAENGGEDRIAREELKANAESLAPEPGVYAVLTVVSVLIATAGLLLNSAATVVGSMVIAPLIGPAMAANVGTVLNDEELFARGMKLQISGLLLAVVTATVFALFVRSTGLVPPTLDLLGIGEIAERVRPDVLSLAIALGAGVAGALSLRSGVSASLVGVMIAVALVPPTAVIGIGIAWGEPLIVVGSTVLVLVNTLSINLAALATFWHAGYRPENWFRLDDAKSTVVTRLGLLVVAVLVLSALLGGVTYTAYQGAVAEDAIREDVDDAVAATTGARLLSVQFVADRDPLARFQHPAPERVIVTVGVDPGESLPGLPERVADLTASHGDPIVEVRYVDTRTAGGGTTANLETRRSVPAGIAVA